MWRQQGFQPASHYESVQEVYEDLAPKVKTLQASLEIVKEFHDMEDLLQHHPDPQPQHQHY